MGPQQNRCGMTTTGIGRPGLVDRASMGPQQNRCGMAKAHATEIEIILLQWGRNKIVAEWTLLARLHAPD